MNHQSINTLSDGNEHKLFSEVNHSENPSSEKSRLMFGPQVADTEIDGLDISEAASCLGVGVDDIWRRIRNGQLIARSYLGRVYVYTDLEKYKESQVQFANENLPPIPTLELDGSETNDQSFALTQIYQSSDDIESNELANNRHDLAVIMNHLSLAKEENREIIRFTTESMSRLSQMTDSMLKMKDDLIQARESQVLELSSLVEQKNDELRRLAKENENLNTVAKFLAD